jgi:hypothetical protein
MRESDLEPATPQLRNNERSTPRIGGRKSMIKFLLWCILLVFCWPLALLALILYPFVWLLSLPFRVVGIAVGGVLALVSAIIFLPARVLRAA